MSKTVIKPNQIDVVALSNDSTMQANLGGGGDISPLTADLDTGGFSIITASSAVLNEDTDNIVITAGSHYHRTGAGGDFGNIDINGGNNSGYIRGGTVTLRGGAGSTWSAAGGNIDLVGGSSTVAAGGTINITSGNDGTGLSCGDINIIGATTTGLSSLPGDVTIQSGSGVGKHGKISIIGGNSNQKDPTNGGDIDIIAGGNINPGAYTYAGQHGGNILVEGGEPNIANINALGGHVTLKPGRGGTTAGPGSVQIASAGALGQGSIDILDDANSFKTTLGIPVLTADTAFILPADNGTLGQVLSTSGGSPSSAVTSWIDPPSASVALNDLTDVIVAGSPLVTDQVLKYNGTNWVNAVDAGSNNWVHANNGDDFVTGSSATQLNAIAIGNAASTGYRDSIAIGTSVTSTNKSVAIGADSDATSSYCVAIGKGAQATQGSATAIGYSALATGSQHIVIGRNCNTNSVGADQIAMGNLVATALAGQIAIGSNITSARVTTDVEHSVRIGRGDDDTNKNLLHLYSKGKLELYGDEAQFVMPTYAVGGSPNNYPANSVEGGLVFDSVNNILRVYDGASWGDVAPVSVPAAATETVAGIVELATQTEVDTGTDTTRAVTSATLQKKAEETAMLMAVIFG